MGEKKAILIIEDDQDIRENLEILLSGEGYPVVTAANGIEALELLRSHRVEPGLIFLDLMMPVMDGREFLNVVEQDPSLPRYPIYVITAAPERRPNGIVGFMRKPLDIREVLRVAERFAA